MRSAKGRKFCDKYRGNKKKIKNTYFHNILCLPFYIILVLNH